MTAEQALLFAQVTPHLRGMSESCELYAYEEPEQMADWLYAADLLAQASTAVSVAIAKRQQEPQ
jgi:hypothetical protein